MSTILYLEQFLSKVFFVEFPKFPQTKTTKVGEEYAATLFYLALKRKYYCNKIIFRHKIHHVRKSERLKRMCQPL